MTRRRRLVAAGVAVACAAAIGVLLWLNGSGSTSEEQITPNDPELSAAADLLRPRLRTDFPDTYSGMILDHAGGIINIYQLDDRELQEVARRMAPGVTIRFHRGQYPELVLEQLSNEIAVDLSDWAKKGVEIHTVGPRADGSGVEVTMSDPSRAVKNRLRAAYDTQAIVVVRGDPVVNPIHTRPLNTAPHTETK